MTRGRRVTGRRVACGRGAGGCAGAGMNAPSGSGADASKPGFQRIRPRWPHFFSCTYRLGHLSYQDVGDRLEPRFSANWAKVAKLIFLRALGSQPWFSDVVVRVSAGGGMAGLVCVSGCAVISSKDSRADEMRDVKNEWNVHGWRVLAILNGDA